MDLYSFIGDNVPTPASKDQAPEAGMTMQTDQSQSVVPYEEAEAQTRSLVETEAFTALKEELFNRLNSLENHVAALKREQLVKDTALGEATALITEKSLEVERLRSDISGLQQAHQETLSRIQKAEEGNQKCLDETERARIDGSVLRRGTQRAVIIACIAALIAIAGLFIYFSKQNAGQQNQARQPVSADTAKSADKTAIAAWPRSPISLKVGDFRISLSPLESETANKLAIETKGTTTATHSFYNLEIRARRGVISAMFLKAPSIDFINKDGIHAKTEGSGSDLRVMHTSMSGKQRLRKGTSLLRYVVSLKKEFQPVGLLIGDLNKRTRSIAIYA